MFLFTMTLFLLKLAFTIYLGILSYSLIDPLNEVETDPRFLFKSIDILHLRALSK